MNTIVNVMKLSFLVIDDRELDCFVAKKLIEHTGKASSIHTFNDGRVALDYISKLSYNEDDGITVILLDLLMPIMNGFEFVEAFEMLDESIKKRYYILAITTSLNKNDLIKISDFESVKGVIRKPVSMNQLSTLLADIAPGF